jgi:DNA mismatch endonuclease (patch repair protein)
MRDAVQPRDPAVTSRIMAAVRSKDTSCELSLRRELWRRGLRYRLHGGSQAGSTLPGRPDIIFGRPRVIVFVDGDFWHGRLLRAQGVAALAATFRSERRDWWVHKIVGNAARDNRNSRLLRSRGWLVIRVWESDVRNRLKVVADRVERAVRRRQRSMPGSGRQGSGARHGRSSI